MPAIDRARTIEERRPAAPAAGGCFLCGGAEEASAVCPNCEETADLPLSHYYLMQYYRCIAD
ncbi:hypothetical protein [Paenibacillus sp.]|uniref:hypothetical protein n=1 Tax=Paenibacillus sp. TaxID=58172 RepID=UPI002D3A32CE|nr:hypothetical protein [Paenibacillus sp.]HZG86381.1 hypothetical protein [Paenibacillus sp.]